MRLIDADALLEELGGDYNNFENVPNDIAVALETIMDAPTINLVTCGECKYLSTTTLGMPYACWYGTRRINDSGADEGNVICTRIDDLKHYCSHGAKMEV